jgi:hypothetical protein
MNSITAALNLSKMFTISYIQFNELYKNSGLSPAPFKKQIFSLKVGISTNKLKTLPNYKGKSQAKKDHCYAPILINSLKIPSSF